MYKVVMKPDKEMTMNIPHLQEIMEINKSINLSHEITKKQFEIIESRLFILFIAMTLSFFMNLILILLILQ